ncbi:TPA: LexA family transcriptional regulator [Photobacterium damselae]
MTCNNEKSKAVEVQLDPFLEQTKGSIKDRLKSLMKGRTTREVAKDWDIPLSTLSGYLSRGSIPPADKAFQIAHKEGCTVEWLVTGINFANAQCEAKATDMVNITKFDIAASAGGGTFIDTEDSSIVTVSRSWLRQNKLTNNKLCIIDARGDSMEPSIRDGDELFLRMVDETPSKPYDGVYVINIDGLLKVKRLEPDFNMSGYRVISDNPAYPEDFVARNELEQRLHVIGEVVRVLGRPSPPTANSQQP